jgi:methionyl-tRNA formyltransferase
MLLCDGGSNQRALAHKIAAENEIIGIVTEKFISGKKPRLWQLVEKVLDRTVFLSIRKSWFDMLGHYEKLFPVFPSTGMKQVSNINSDDVIDHIKKAAPDLLIVSGTSLLRKKILSIPIKYGIINLHTGLSPYVKGAPNCTNWCVANSSFHLIGNTIMWIDAGIDSGDILTTETSPVAGYVDLLDLQIKVMDHAHDLYVRAIHKIREDFENCPRVKQSTISAGKTFYNKDWNWKPKIRLLRNLEKGKRYFGSKQYEEDLKGITTINI